MSLFRRPKSTRPTTPEETREGWRQLLRDEGNLDALAVMEQVWQEEDDEASLRGEAE